MRFERSEAGVVTGMEATGTAAAADGAASRIGAAAIADGAAEALALARPTTVTTAGPLPAATFAAIPSPTTIVPDIPRCNAQAKGYVPARTKR